MISPAAHFYLRTYGLTEKDVKTNDPRGILQKYEVLDYVMSNKLEIQGHKSSKPQKS